MFSARCLRIHTELKEWERVKQALAARRPKTFPGGPVDAAGLHPLARLITLTRLSRRGPPARVPGRCRARVPRTVLRRPVAGRHGGHVQVRLHQCAMRPAAPAAHHLLTAETAQADYVLTGLRQLNAVAESTHAQQQRIAAAVQERRAAAEAADARDLMTSAR